MISNRDIKRSYQTPSDPPHLETLNTWACRPPAPGPWTYMHACIHLCAYARAYMHAQIPGHLQIHERLLGVLVAEVAATALIYRASRARHLDPRPVAHDPGVLGQSLVRAHGGRVGQLDFVGAVLPWVGGLA
jgi:hypothetical protein